MTKVLIPLGMESLKLQVFGLSTPSHIHLKLFRWISGCSLAFQIIGGGGLFVIVVSSSDADKMPQILLVLNVGFISVRGFCIAD